VPPTIAKFCPPKLPPGGLTPPFRPSTMSVPIAVPSGLRSSNVRKPTESRLISAIGRPGVSSVLDVRSHGLPQTCLWLAHR
jgi:hypothetical protein